MARRVGFSDTRRDETHRDAEDARAGAARRSAPPRKRWIPIGFLSLWLALWSAGIALAIGALFDSWRDGETAGTLFLCIWIFFAAIGWLFAVQIIRKLLRGEPVALRGRGAARSLSEDEWSRDVRR